MVGIKKRWIELFWLIFAVSGPLCGWAAERSPCCPSNWRGLYVSALLGSEWNCSSLEFNNANYFNTFGAEVVGSKFHFDPNGFVGGGALGYNFQNRWLVVGWEARALGTLLKRSQPSPFFPDLDLFTYRLRWLADVRLRAGYAYRCLLPFVSAGWVGSRVNLELKDIAKDITDEMKKWVNGWTVGVGLDWKIARELSTGFSYDYAQFRFKNRATSCPLCGSGVGFGTPAVSGRLHAQTFTVRINMHL